MATLVPFHSASARVLGINLRPGGDKLAKQIESRCAKTLDIQYQDMESRGMNRLLPDGTPVVRINPKYRSIVEELIVHELGHLLLALDGFPRYDWFFDTSAPSERVDEQQALPDWLALHVLDPLEHRIFYPQLKRSGYHPEAWRIDEMNFVISQRSYGQDITSPLETGARYCQVALELRDDPILQKMEKWYEAVGWTAGMDLGKRAYAEVIGISHWTPTAALSAFTNISNVLLEPLKWRLISQGTVIKNKGGVKESYGQIHLRYG